MRDLIGASAEEIAEERARVATEGVGARLLGLQGTDGSWAGVAWNRGWNSTRKADVTPDERVAEAIELVESKRDVNRRWPLENQHPGVMPVELGESPGQPSRWITLRALRVLDWSDN